MARRPICVKPIFAALVVLPLLAACSPGQTPHGTPERSGASVGQDGGTSLTQDEVTKAQAVAGQVIADHRGASVSNATAIERPGKVADSNTGHPCTSGRELRVKLIGKFPHSVTLGHPVPPGSPVPDFRVRAIVVTVDAESELACLISVQTGENGEPKPLAGGTALSVR